MAQLLDIINKKYYDYGEPLEININEISHKDKERLLRWFYGVEFSYEIENVKTALDMFTWCFLEALDLDLQPLDIINSKIDHISKTLGLNKKQVLELVYSFRSTFFN